MVDPASTSSSTTLATKVPVYFDTGNAARNVAVTSDLSRVVYGVSIGSAPGIYVAPVP